MSELNLFSEWPEHFSTHASRPNEYCKEAETGCRMHAMRETIYGVRGENRDVFSLFRRWTVRRSHHVASECGRLDAMPSV
jgi:hypothetical protein